MIALFARKQNIDKVSELLERLGHIESLPINTNMLLNEPPRYVADR
jgi:hypothetical protein